MTSEEKYISRCISLALLGIGNVSPNPMVGSVLVCNDKIIGEGFHECYGHPHAEVNCLASVSENDQHLIPESTLYVSLEPCAHFGKTPPCADLIIQNKIKRVVIGCRDPFIEVNGKGIEKLRNANIDVSVGILEKECEYLNRRFFMFHRQKRPYIILKWAQSSDHFISDQGNHQLAISNDLSNRAVHKWRSEESAIMVGTNTALKDNPSLTTRLANGKNPIRLVMDKNLNIPAEYNIFNDQAKTIVFNEMKDATQNNIIYKKVETKSLTSVLNYCYESGIQSILVEGGSKLLQSFLDEGLVDEIRMITNTEMKLSDGIKAPVFKSYSLVKTLNLKKDTIEFYEPDIR